MRRRIFLLLPVALLLFAGYVLYSDEYTILKVPAGSGPQRVSIRLFRGVRTGDEFQFYTSSKQLPVTLVTPGGARITEATAESAGAIWRSDDFAPPLGKVDAGQFNTASFLTPHESGEYALEIAHGIPSEAGFVGVRFKRSSFDLGSVGYLVAIAAFRVVNALPRGELKTQSYVITPHAYVGQPFEYVIGLVGPEVRDPVQSQVQMEYRSVQMVNGHEDLGEPIVETVPADFARDPQGRYTAHLTPNRTGRLRVGAVFTGELAKGGKFRVETFPSSEIHVDPVAVRFLGWSEQAVDVNRDGVFDRLDVSVNLDVVEAGPYSLSGELMYRGSGWQGLGFFQSEELRAGKQTLTASVDATEIRALMIGGAWDIQALCVYRGLVRDTESPATQVVRGAKTRMYRVAEWRESRQR
jgi:hypothetical protein